MPDYQIDQIQLVCAILKELARQGKEQNPPVEVEARPDQYNVIISAATAICTGMRVKDRRCSPGCGITAWLNSHDTGVSSLTMAAAIYHAGELASRPHRWSHPHDAADFGRCLGFLEAVPGTEDKLYFVERISPEWAALISQWDSLTEEYRKGNFLGVTNAIQSLIRAASEPAK